MSLLVDNVNGVLDDWNHEIKQRGSEFHFEIEYGIRTKKLYINRNDFIEKEIADIILYQRADSPQEKDLLLFRRELAVPKKMKHQTKASIERELIDVTYKLLLYEMLGVFCVSTKQLIVSRDYAEYDIERDRLKQHESAVDMVIKTLKSGPFFEVGNEFDVFMDLEGDYYAVYTQHEIGLKNNGIARIPKSDCMIIQQAKKQIILLDK